MKSNFAATAGAALLAATALAGCTRQEPSDIGVKRNWGGSLSVDTNPGLKLTLFGTKYRFISTGSHPIHIIAIAPGTTPATGNNDGTATGVVKTTENLPLQGNIVIWLDMNAARDKANAEQVKDFYLKNPPLQDEKQEEYLNRILTRLAGHALDAVQAEYKTVSVDQFGTSGTAVKKTLVTELNKSFAEQGFGIVTVEDVVLSGINLGAAAEAANQQIGLASVSKKVAAAQKDAAPAQQDAQDSLAPQTMQLVKQFRDAGVAPEAIPNIVCTYYLKNDPEFAKRNPAGCFGMKIK